jgi:hypothetical protein
MPISAAKLMVEIGVENSKLEKGLRDAESRITDFSDSGQQHFQGLADEVTRSGENLGNATRSVDDWIGALKNATPENARLASAAASVTKKYQDGKISTDEARKSLEKLRREMKENEQASMSMGEKMGAAFKEVGPALAGFAAGVFVLKQAGEKMYEFGRQGAELEYTASMFDRLTGSINKSSDIMMVKLRQATGYTLSDMNAMASATDFLSLGLAKNGDQAIRLSRVSGQLGMDMNQLVLTLTNQTKARFDQLHVSVAGFDERLQKLKDSGMDVNDAFTEAFLQQAEMQIENVGSILDEDISGFMKFEAALSNLADRTKREWSPVFAELADDIATILNASLVASDGITLLNEDLITGKISYEQYKEAVDALIEPMGVFIDENGEFATGAAQSVGAMNELRESTQYLTPELANAAGADWGLQQAAEAAETSLKNQQETTDELKDATNNANEAMKKYSEQLLFTIASKALGDNEDAILALAQKMGLVDEATVKATEKVNEYQEMLASGKIDIDVYNALVAGLADAIEGLPENVNIDFWLTTHGTIPNTSGLGSGQIITSGTGKQYEREALGGAVYPGHEYWVGERGPEPFIPFTAGRIVPNNQSGGRQVVIEAGSIMVTAPNKNMDIPFLVDTLIDEIQRRIL